MLLVWALRGLEPEDFSAHIRGADPRWLTAAVLVVTLTFPLRLMRWRLMLRDAQGQPLSPASLWHALAIGFMANNLLPARVGELARAYVAKRRTAVPFTTALVSIGVERMLDGLALVALLALVVASHSLPRAASAGGVLITRLLAVMTAVFVGAFMLGLAAAYRPATLLAWLNRGAARRLIPLALARRLRSLGTLFVGGLSVLKSPSRLAGAAGWSLAVWLTNAASYALCFRAFHIGVAPEAALLLQALVAFGVAVPAAPGFVGVFEAITRAALGLYGVAPDLAVSYAVVYHITSFTPITILGLYSLYRVGIRLTELTTSRASGT